jgi:hypothetical protein
MKKIKIFRDHEEYCVNPSGSSYVTGTWAQNEAEEFINRKDVEVLSIHYAGGRDNQIMVIYEEIR